jgi:hypothetical protein
MDTLNDIISGLKWGNLDPTDAHDRVLRLFNVSDQLPLDFVKWYSGMDEEKILKAYERWKKECGD